MKKKQFLALALSVVMAGGMLAGCGSSNGSSSSSKGDAKDEVVTLKWIQVGNGMPKDYDEWLEQINPYLEEKIGVNVDMEIVPWGDWDNRRSVITNSGEYFDILFTDQNRYSSEVNTGALMDITDLLKDNASELYDMIPEDYWKAVEVNGKIYGVPTYKDSSLSEYFVWDQDIADKYNIDVNSVTDFNTLYDALKTVKEGEGGSPYFMSKNGANFLLNLNNGDAPTADDSSKYAMFFAAQGWSGAAKTTWGPNNGIANCSAVQYGNTVVSNTTVRGSINGIYSGCKHPDKALQLLNLVNTDSKVRDWFYYGAEGKDFEYTDDNKVHRLTTDWGMAGYTQGTFFNVTQTDDVDFNQWDEVEELNEKATPSEMLGFNLDTSNIETELANCRAVYEKYYSELFTGAQDPRELVKTIDAELETAGWETIREEAQKQIDAQK